MTGVKPKADAWRSTHTAGALVVTVTQHCWPIQSFADTQMAQPLSPSWTREWSGGLPRCRATAMTPPSVQTAPHDAHLHMGCRLGP